VNTVPALGAATDIYILKITYLLYSNQWYCLVLDGWMVVPVRAENNVIWGLCYSFFTVVIVATSL
jgi:hypothetical protein